MREAGGGGEGPEGLLEEMIGQIGRSQAELLTARSGAASSWQGNRPDGAGEGASLQCNG
jgi:hypothetical protein